MRRESLEGGSRSALLRRPTYWAGAAPLLCAVHCLVTPVFVMLMPWLSPLREAEAILLAASAAVAIGFTHSGVRAHGRQWVWVPVAVGLMLVGTALGLEAEGAVETAMIVVGSLAMAAGLLLNARLRHAARCRRCGCPAHED